MSPEEALVKREFDRVPLTTSFRFRRREDGDAPHIESSPVHADVSVTGVFVPTKWHFPTDTRVELEFTLPRRVLPLQLDGRVVWSGTVTKGTGMGIAFRRLDARERQAIRRYAEGK